MQVGFVSSVTPFADSSITFQKRLPSRDFIVISPFKISLSTTSPNSLSLYTIEP
ncbi:MAG: hypothetical protein O2779_04500 [Nanoarchaeota archaeon]|nr:hypothetical protein [Nanoarchaeota archaeon]